MNSPSDGAFDADVGFLDVPPDQADGDPLALFESESAPNRADASPTGRSSEAPPSAARLLRVRRPIALDQVLHRLGNVAWAEAVAIVEALCGVLTASGSSRVPEMSHVAITAGGTVVAGTGGEKHAGPALARMLNTLAATGSLPAPLRLFVTRWASAGEEHSIGEFAKELGYFVRPDGQLLIQAVYERAVATVPIPVSPQPAPARREPPPRRRPQAPISRGLYGAAAAVVVVGVVLTALFAWSGVLSPARQSSTASLTTAPSEADGGGEQASIAGVGESAGTDAPGPSQITAGPRTPGVSTPPNPAARSTQAASPSAAPRVGSAAGTPAPVSSAVRASLASSSIASSPRSVPAPPATGDSLAGATGLNPPRPTRRDDASGPPIYSRTDPDVTPPVFQHPQVPAQVLSGLQPDMNTMELIVSETGTVERVRLLSTPKRMADMMLLSGAKNWEFEPAMKDGQPVRYRLELSWAATP